MRATDPEGARLPSGDRVAHLLLALRSDEEGFATVANLAFSGARWRVRRRLPRRQRVALDAVCQSATLLGMSYSEGAEKPEKPSLLKRALALVILAVVVVLVAKIVIGFVMAIFWIVVAVVAVVAVLWALGQLLSRRRAMAYLVIAIWFGICGGVVGRIKGGSFFIWFLISAVVPVLGLITALLYRWDSEELRRQCPAAGGSCKLHDAICTGCGTELEFPEVAIASEAEVASGGSPTRGIPRGSGEFHW